MDVFPTQKDTLASKSYGALTLGVLVRAGCDCDARAAGRHDKLVKQALSLLESNVAQLDVCLFAFLFFGDTDAASGGAQSGRLFGVVMGGMHANLRLISSQVCRVVDGAPLRAQCLSDQKTAQFDVGGFSLAGFGLGESLDERQKMLQIVVNNLPANKVRLLAGLRSIDEVRASSRRARMVGAHSLAGCAVARRRSARCVAAQTQRRRWLDVLCVSLVRRRSVAQRRRARVRTGRLGARHTTRRRREPVDDASTRSNANVSRMLAATRRSSSSISRFDSTIDASTIAARSRRAFCGPSLGLIGSLSLRAVASPVRDTRAPTCIICFARTNCSATR